MMPRALHLADVARSTGLPVVEVDGWKTRGSTLFDPRYIVAHHTGTPARVTGDYPSLHVVTDGHGKLPGPLSQFGLGRSGTIYVIAAGRANHAGAGRYPDGTEGNRWSYGIEAEHPGDDEPWRPRQYDAYCLLVAALCEYHGWPASRVVGHKEYAPTRKVDPTFSMDTFRLDVADVRAGRRATTDEEYQPMKRGDSGNDVRKMQVRLRQVGQYGGAIDGDYGPKTETAVASFQESQGLDVTGRVSLWTAVHLQAVAHGVGSHA